LTRKYLHISIEPFLWLVELFADFMADELEMLMLL